MTKFKVKYCSIIGMINTHLQVKNMFELKAIHLTTNN